MFHLGETPADPMELISEPIAMPKIHLYNGDDGNMCPWVSKQTSLGRVLVPTDKLPNQPDVPTPEYAGYIDPQIPEMPQKILNTAAAFFRLVLEAAHTEAALLLALDEEDNYHLYCPEQEVDYTGVDWKDTVELEEGHYLMGSIHSHCDFSAFHSGTDEGDAAKNDGLHITLGHLDKDEPEVDVMIAFSGIKWQKWDLGSFIEGGAWTPLKVDDESQNDLIDLDWLDELKEPRRWTSYGVKGGQKFGPTKGHTPNGGHASNYGYMGWDDDDWDDWELWGDGYGDISWHEKKKPGWEKSTDDRSGIGNYKRINRDSNWYDDDQELAQDQIIKDMSDLTLLAQEVGMTISFSIHKREGHFADEVGDMTPPQIEEEIKHADA